MTADRPDWPGPTPRGRAIIAAIRAEMNWQKPAASEPCEVCQPAAEQDWMEWVADQRRLRFDRSMTWLEEHRERRSG